MSDGRKYSLILEPRLVSTLKLLGPKFKPVSERTLADARGIEVSSARRIFQGLAQRGLARRVSGGSWAITGQGQLRLRLPDTAEDEYLEWLWVVCDAFVENPIGNLSPLALVQWADVPCSWLDDSQPAPEWQELAAHMAVVLSGSELVASQKPDGQAISTLKRATFAVFRVDLAERVRAAFSTDLKRGKRENNLRIDRLGWAIRHLDAVIRQGKPYSNSRERSGPVEGGSLWGDIGTTGDVKYDGH